MKEQDMRNQMEKDIVEIHDALGITEIPNNDENEEYTKNVTNELTEEERSDFLKYYQAKMSKQLEEQKAEISEKMKENEPKINKEPVKEEVVVEVEKPKEEPPKKEKKFKEKPEIKMDEVKIEVEKPKEEKVEKDDEIEFNINDIEFVDEPDGVTSLHNFKAAFDLTDTYQVVCNQSKYIANMKAIKYGDVLAIANSTASAFQERSKLYQMVYNKIESTSIDIKGNKMSYDTFLKTTSFYDLESLLFGIYQKSFPGTTEFDIECKHCKGASTIEVDNEKLIAIKDESVYADIQEVLKKVSNPEEARRASVLNKVTRKLLKQSKVLVDIRIPSLYNHLDLIGSVSPDKLESNQQLLTLMLFIKEIYMLDVESSKAAGKPRYYPITSREEMANVIENLPIKDSKDLGKMIGDIISEVEITYKIKSFPCPKCNEQLGDMDVDIEKLVFYNALQ